jgi:ABC-type uncharacterized transport system permease subunit
MPAETENGRGAAVAGETSVTSLATGILHDAQTLMEQQLELFKQEVRIEIADIKAGVAVIVVGVAIALIGGVLLGFALVTVLQELTPQLPPSACFAIIGGIILAIGAAISAVALAKFRTLTPLPPETTEALKENLQWKTIPK